MERMPAKTVQIPSDEQFGVVRIRLIRTGCSAVVAELRAADRLLLTWSDSSEPALDFEMTFDDGCAVFGRYEYERSKKRPPSLSRYMRRTFKSLRQEPPCWPDGLQFLKVPTADASRYIIEGT